MGISLKGAAEVIYILHYQFPSKLDYKSTLNLISNLTIKDQKFILSIQNEDAQKRSLFGRIILKYIISELEIEEPTIIQNFLNGKPFFLEYPFINFNISHSGEMVVCSLTRGAAIGIDIEYNRPIDLEEFRQYFHHEGWSVIMKSNWPIRVFFDLWTRKEATIKADGRGMEIDISLLNGLNTSAEIRENKWFVQNIDLRKEYSSAIACEKIKPFHILNLNEIVKFESFLNLNLNPILNSQF